jgi:hypothetical protein
MDDTHSPTVYTPFPIPAVSNDMRPTPLSRAEEEKRLQVISHFSSDDYRLPDIEANGTLMEIEKYWLVSISNCFALGNQSPMF